MLKKNRQKSLKAAFKKVISVYNNHLNLYVNGDRYCVVKNRYQMLVSKISNVQITFPIV